MLMIYTGVPGSGKSCHVSKDICRWLSRGQFVLANFDYRADPWEDHFIRIPDYPKAEHIQRLVRGLPRLRREHNAILVIDEAQRCFNSRTWNNSGRDDFIRFFTLSRHMGVDVVLIAQSSAMVDKQIRACLQTEVVHMRLSAMGTIPFVMSFFGMLPICFYKEKYFGSRLKLSSGFFLPRKKWWDRYDSYDLTFTLSEDKAS